MIKRVMLYAGIVLTIVTIVGEIVFRYAIYAIGPQQQSGYFSQFITRDEVESHLLTMVSLDSLSYQELDNFIKSETYDLECTYTNVEIGCFTPSNREYVLYNINFKFKGDMLHEIVVFEVWVGL